MKRLFIIPIIIISIVWADRPITAEDIVSMRYATQPAMNKAGTKIAYVNIIPRTKDEPRGGSYREI